MRNTGTYRNTGKLVITIQSGQQLVWVKCADGSGFELKRIWNK